MIYLVVKESGEYSDWTKENVMYFTNEDEANEYVTYCQTMSDIHKQDEIFKVEMIRTGKIPENKDQLIAEAYDKRNQYEAEMKEYQKQLKMKQEEISIKKMNLNYGNIVQQRKDLDNELAGLRNKQPASPMFEA